jgi:hypothetical protein
MFSVAVTEEGTGWDDFGASSLMLHAVTGAAGEAPGLAPGKTSVREGPGLATE